MWSGMKRPFIIFAGTVVAVVLVLAGLGRAGLIGMKAWDLHSSGNGSSRGAESPYLIKRSSINGTGIA
jgi:hypothetical protein